MSGTSCFNLGVGIRSPTRLIAVAALCSGFALLTVGCEGEVRRSGLPIQDDFSGDCDWSDDEDENVSLGCTGGEYRVLFKSTEKMIEHLIPRRSEEAVNAVSVEADATLRAFPDASENDYEFHGVGCWVSPARAPGQGYLFLVNPEKEALAIIKMDETAPAEQGFLKVLLDEESEAVPSIGEKIRVRGECRATEDRVNLTMFLEGEQVGSATDAPGFRGFAAFGFLVLATQPGTDIRYDNFTAEELD